ncbi:MAG TPA: hypothetical protein VF756_20350 [Thermoanaerobaculia bacterium]
MKKVVLFALLLATFAAVSAQALSGPRFGVIYTCYYSDNYTGAAVSPGWSFWQKRAGGSASLIYTTENFKTSWGSDGYLATWAKPYDVGYPYYYTRWEYTFNPYGPQCKDTRVYGGGTYIEFHNCTDGHSRTCWTEAP